MNLRYWALGRRDLYWTFRDAINDTEGDLYDELLDHIAEPAIQRIDKREQARTTDKAIKQMAGFYRVGYHKFNAKRQRQNKAYTKAIRRFHMNTWRRYAIA